MKNPQELLAKVESLKKENPLDLSLGEDLAVGVMNLVSIEEHLFFSFEKTGETKYLDLLNEIRLLRIESYKRLNPDQEGESWCTGKHLLASSMRFMEVGTKSLKAGNKDDAKLWFDKSFELFGLFWKVTGKGSFTDSPKVLDHNRSKIANWLKHSLDCCKE